MTFWSSRLSWKKTDPFRWLHGIYLKLTKENQKSTTHDRLALETPIGSQSIMHAQKPPWTLDAWHVDILNEGKLLSWLRLSWISWDLTRITTGSYNVLKLRVELHSKLVATQFMVFNVTLYLGLRNILTSYDMFCCVFTKIK